MKEHVTLCIGNSHQAYFRTVVDVDGAVKLVFQLV